MVKHLKDNRGFTLVELIVATIVSLVIVAATYMVYISQQKGYLVVDSHSDKLQSARITIDSVTRSLRQAGFGVISGQVLLDAKTYEMTFRGDVDNDISVALADVAVAGATEIKVDLDDEEHSVDATDFILLKQGDNKELLAVRTAGEAFDLSGEPDTIFLADPLENTYDILESNVRTVETMSVQHNYSDQEVLVNGEELAGNVLGLDFHYYNEAGTELVPETAQSLSLLDRVNVRKIILNVETAGADPNSPSRHHRMIVELRNMERPSIKNDVIPPMSPTNLQIIDDETCGHFTIRYDRPTQNLDNSEMVDLAGYNIYYGLASGSYFQPAYPVGDEAQTEAQVADARLEHGLTYYVAMTAYDTSFNESELSSEVTFTLEDTVGPPQITLVDAVSGEGYVQLNWEAPPEVVDIKGYRIYRGDNEGFGPQTPIASEDVLDDQATSFMDTDIETCKRYFYKILAVDCANEGVISADVFGDGVGSFDDQPVNNQTNTTATETPPTAPQPVGNAAANGGNQEIQLSWINPTDADFAGVMIRFSTVSYPYNENEGEELGKFLGQPGATMTYLHSQLTNGQTYYYTFWASDSCGNLSYTMNAEATPGINAPVVEILYPAPGALITDGHLAYQARAYDSDQSTLSRPPNIVTDNGKGIQSIVFTVDPMPTWSGQFPRTEYLKEYCGFGGTISTCSLGDVTSWCDGTYNLYAIATDDEGEQTQSAYREIKVQNGGLYTDETFTQYLSGTYKNEITFQVKNTAGSAISMSYLIPTWDRDYMRLGKVEIPEGNVVFDSMDYPYEKEWWVYLGSGTDVTLSSMETTTIKLTFIHNKDYLTQAASVGDTTLYIGNNPTLFPIGQSIYIYDGVNQETAVVAGYGSYSLTLANPVQNNWSTAWISRVADQTMCPISSATIGMKFVYSLDYLSQECTTEEFEMTVVEGPTVYNAQQDLPGANTNCVTDPGSLTVFNYRNVPMHVDVTDNSGSGIQTVKFYYKYDGDMLSVAPASGYSSSNMEYDGNWDFDLPYSNDNRVWFYFDAVDYTGQSTRLPESGAYTFDFVAEQAAPNCPLGLYATKVDKKTVRLTWTPNTETDLLGYNIYRSKDCGSYYRVYTQITDLDPNTPGVQYTDYSSKNDADKYCYTYYITALDLEQNESEGCTVYTSTAGDCPCP